MAAQARNLDSQFYQPPDAFFPAHASLGLTFDDLTLATHYSGILPRDTQLETQLADVRLRFNQAEQVRPPGGVCRV